MARRRFRPDADLDAIVSEADLRRARAVNGGNLAAVYDRLHDRLPEEEREQTLAPLRALIVGDTGTGRGTRRWITRHRQDLIDYNRYVMVRELQRIGKTDLADEMEQRLGFSGRAIMESYSRVRKALRTGDDARYYFSRRLLVACDEYPDGLRALPDPDLLNALPRL